MTNQLESQKNKKPFMPEKFKEIYSKVPRVTVDLVIKNPNGIVLTLRDHYSWKGQWHFPGGTIYYKETVMQAINRVALNEIGVPVEMVELLDYIEYPSEEKQRGFGSTISLGFLCKTNKVEFVTNEDASAVDVFSVLPQNIILEQGQFLKKHWEVVQALKLS